MNVLDSLIAAPRAWQTVDQLARSMRVDYDQVADQIVDLEVSGMVCTWSEWPEGIAVTLTPLGASRLGVKIIETGPEETPRWVDRYEVEPPPPVARRTFRDPGVLGLVVDESRSPLDQLIFDEQLRSSRRKVEVKDSGAWWEARREADRAEEARKRRKASKKRKRCTV